MKTTIKTFLVAALVAFSVGVKAQESANSSYEFAIIEGGSIAYGKLTITTSGNTEYVSYPKDITREQFLLQKVEEFSKQGWQVFNTNMDGNFAGHQLFYLKRKTQ